MNASELPAPPPNTMAVRVGCKLSYQAAVPTTILLLFKPRVCNEQLLVEEDILFGNQMPVEQLLDSHGNILFKTMLMPGLNEYRHDAIFYVPDSASNQVALADSIGPLPLQAFPIEVLRYTMPSRYCESDKLLRFAQEKFGHVSHPAELAHTISEWTHANIEYRYGSGSNSLSALDVIQRGYGVCRDFAHTMVALCRALDLPARYVAGHVPYVGVAEGDIGIDFHAYCEVYFGGRWHTFDPRHKRAHPGRVKIAHGMDAVDAAFATIYGNADLVKFQVWAYQVNYPQAKLGDPVAITKGDNGWAQFVTCG